MNIIDRLIERARTDWGRAIGYGWCYHCSRTWNYIKDKTISYSVSEGMFPLCEDCFDKLSPTEINPYIEQLVAEWVRQSGKYQLGWSNTQSPEQIIELAKAEVLKMKEDDK